MKTLQACIDSLCEQARHPARTVKAACQATGKPAVGCFPLFVPEELVYAAGFLPVGLWGGVSAFQKADHVSNPLPAPSSGQTWSWGCRGPTMS